ncbi:hypothetical protein [Thalassobacillus pellis]|uniref:hypothetical protein n=1 Tax=Thalassobacillus pellis TaxID=748008 RepID=UPI00196040B7|nr:hypothetical protein [Thalassobacillus pellis]MBM7554580.1 hypothetical protein [Thalassobacillus pellis]
MGLKLTILLNKETNELLDRLALRMGTSKRNVVLLGLSNILMQGISKEDLDQMENRIDDLTHSTNITVNETFKKRLMEVQRYGLSIRKFFGYIICDYFQKHYHEFFPEDCVEEEKELPLTKKDVVQTAIDKCLKDKIISYCYDQSISVNSLFAYYILNKPIKVWNFKSGNKELMDLSFGVSVRNKLIDDATNVGMSKSFYLNLIAVQMSYDLDL